VAENLNGDTTWIMAIIDKISMTFVGMIQDFMRLFTDLAPSFIMIFFLLTILVLAAGIVLTVFFIISAALNNTRRMRI
jgi:hypothetical protein